MRGVGWGEVVKGGGVGGGYGVSLLLVKEAAAAGFWGGGDGWWEGLSGRVGGGVPRFKGAVRWVCCQGTRSKPSKINHKR